MVAVATLEKIMPVTENLRVMELLASRICHDLISPVGAISNGVELLEEMGAQVGEEAAKLIGHSSEQAARRLRLFRLCYGAAGADTNLSCDDALQIARDYLGGSRVSLSWDAASMKDSTGQQKGLPKVLLNLLIVAIENLVHGGTIEVSKAGNQVKLGAVGRGAGSRVEAWPALKGEVAVDDLTARSVHPYITAKFAEHYGVKLDWSQSGEDKLEMAING
jgi:histidine phosphotransferase ChpT